MLLGLKKLGDSLQILASIPLKKSLAMIYKNPLRTLISGSLTSLFTQSGMTARFMAMSYANSGLFTLKQLVFFTLGAGLGSTIITWLFVVQWGWLELFFLGFGLFPAFYLNSGAVKHIGKLFLSVGLLMLGARIMYSGVSSFPELATFVNLLTLGYVNNKLILLIFILVSAILSALLRSSVVMVLIAIILFEANYLDIIYSLSIVLGASLSEVTPLLIIVNKVNRLAKKGIAFNGLAKIISITLAFFFLEKLLLFNNGVLSFFGTYRELDESGVISTLIIPLFFFTFTLMHIIISFIFSPLYLRLIDFFFKSKVGKEAQKLQFIGDINHVGPFLALEQAFQELKKMSAMVESILHLTMDVIGTFSPNNEAVERILKYEEVTDNFKTEMNEFMAHIVQLDLTYAQGLQVKSILSMTNELESIADKCKAVFYLQKEMNALGSGVGKEFVTELKDYFNEVHAYYELLFSDFLDDETIFTDKVIEDSFKAKELGLTVNYTNLSKAAFRLVGKSPEFSFVLAEILFNIKLITSHTSNIYNSYRSTF